MEDACYECSKHSFGECADCQEITIFAGLLDEAVQYNVLPEGGMPDTVVDVEAWMIALLEKAGVDESIVEYWKGNLEAVRG